MRSRRCVCVAAAVSVAVLALLLAERDGDRPSARARRALAMAETRGAIADERADTRAPDASFPVRVLDLADGRPVTGLQVRCRLRSGRVTDLATGADGVVALDPACVDVAPADDAWRLCGSARDGVLWAWRSVRIIGIARSAEPDRPLDPAAVALSGRYGGAPADGGALGPAPWRTTWLREHGVPAAIDLGPPRADGTFEIELPRIRGYGIRARADGWETAWTVPFVDSRTEEIAVDLVMRPALSVRGVAYGPDGRALAHATVRVYVVRRGRHDDFSAGHLFVELEDAFAGEWIREDDYARVTAVHQVRTGEDGRFDLRLRTRGELWLVAHADGLAPSECPLGVVAADRDGVELRLAPPDRPGRIQVRAGDEVLRERRLLLADLSVREVQATYPLTTDREGFAAADWLRPGRRYAISDGRGHRGFFTWNGETILDIARMSKSMREP